MRHYLILTQPSEAYAEQLSAALWRLSRPIEVRKDDEVSKFYTNWIIHPDGNVALFIPEEMKPVHLEGDIESFVQLTGNPDVTLTTIDEEENETTETLSMRDLLEARRGGRLNIKTTIENSPSLSPNLKTEKQMEADGWFSQPEEL